MTDKKEWVTVAEAARITGQARSKIYKLIDSGQVSFNDKGVTLVNLPDLEKLLVSENIPHTATPLSSTAQPTAEQAQSQPEYDLTTLEGKAHYCAMTVEGMEQFSSNASAMFSGDRAAEVDCCAIMTWAHGHSNSNYIALAQVWFGYLADYLAEEIKKVAGGEESPAYLNYLRWNKFMQWSTKEDTTSTLV